MVKVYAKFFEKLLDVNFYKEEWFIYLNKFELFYQLTLERIYYMTPTAIAPYYGAVNLLT